MCYVLAAAASAHALPFFCAPFFLYLHLPGVRLGAFVGTAFPAHGTDRPQGGTRV